MVIAHPIKTPDWQYLEELGPTEALFWCKALLANRKTAALRWRTGSKVPFVGTKDVLMHSAWLLMR